MDMDTRPEPTRMEELEARLHDLESRRRRGGAWFRSIVPAEASQHFRAAGREQLMGMRALVDHWIKRLDDADRRVEGKSGREEITIE